MSNEDLELLWQWMDVNNTQKIPIDSVIKKMRLNEMFVASKSTRISKSNFLWCILRQIL